MFGIMGFNVKLFFKMLLLLALFNSAVLQDPFGSGSSEVVDRIKLRGRSKDKCRFFKSNPEEFQRCRNITAFEITENGTKLDQLNGTIQGTEETVITTVVIDGTAETSSVSSSDSSPIVTAVTSTLDSASGTITNAVAGSDVSADATDSISNGMNDNDIASSRDGNITSISIGIKVNETTSDSKSTKLKTSADSTKTITSPSSKTNRTDSNKTSPSTLTSKSPLSSKKNTRSTTSSNTEVTKLSRKFTTTAKSIRNPLVIEEAKFLNISRSKFNLNQSKLNNVADDNETAVELSAGMKLIEAEINEANADEEPLSLFDGQKLKKCGNLVHPISKITFWMKKTNITKEYFDHRCDTNYHDACDDQWKNCAIRGAQLFCTANCSPTNCGLLKSFGYDQDDQPFYAVESCNDNPRYKCSYLRERGDCLALDKGIAKICPKTCNYCAQSREFLPFMPEQHKLTLWLHKFENGKYANYAKYIWRQLDLIQNRILAGKCLIKS